MPFYTYETGEVYKVLVAGEVHCIHRPAIGQWDYTEGKLGGLLIHAADCYMCESGRFVGEQSAWVSRDATVFWDFP